MAIDFDKYKSRRIELGLSQQEVADALGITLRAYHYYEKKEREPKLATVKLLDELLFSGNMNKIPGLIAQNIEDKEKELLYENFMLKIQWQLRNFEKELAGYQEGVIEVYYRPEGPGVNISGFPDRVEGKIWGAIMLLDKTFVREINSTSKG